MNNNIDWGMLAMIVAIICVAVVNCFAIMFAQ